MPDKQQATSANNLKQRSRYNPFLRVIASALVFCFFSQEIVFSQGSEQAKAEINFANFAVPQDIGLTKDIKKTSSQELIINIKDIHDNFSAQESVSAILDNLVKNYDIRTIGIEGSDGALDMSFLSAFPDKDSKELASKQLMRDGVLSAGEFFQVMNESNIGLYGMDDEKLYIQNVQAFKKALEHKKLNYKRVQALIQSLDALCNKTFSEELKDLNKNGVLAFNSGVKFSDRWNVVAALAKKYNVSTASYDNINRLLVCTQSEKAINFKLTNSERETLMDSLVKLLTRDKLEKLILESVNYKLGRISQGSFSSYLIAAAQEAGVNMQQYPNLQAYSKYMMMYEAIDIEVMKDEIQDLEGLIRMKMYRDDNEKKLYELKSHAEIIRDLFEVKLSNASLKYFRAHRGQFSPEAFEIVVGAGSGVNFKDIDAIFSEIPAVLEFYDLAEKRNEVLLSNMIKKMRENGQTVGCLLTGGFHSRGITELLKANNTSYIVILPRFNKDAKRPYLTIITNTKNSYKEFLESDMAVEARQTATAYLYGYSAAKIIKKNPTLGSREINQLVGDEIGKLKKEYLNNYKNQHSSNITNSSTSLGAVSDKQIQKTSSGEIESAQHLATMSILRGAPVDGVDQIICDATGKTILVIIKEGSNSKGIVLKISENSTSGEPELNRTEILTGSKLANRITEMAPAQDLVSPAADSGVAPAPSASFSQLSDAQKKSFESKLSKIDLSKISPTDPQAFDVLLQIEKFRDVIRISLGIDINKLSREDQVGLLENLAQDTTLKSEAIVQVIQNEKQRLMPQTPPMGSAADAASSVVTPVADAVVSSTGSVSKTRQEHEEYHDSIGVAQSIDKFAQDLGIAGTEYDFRQELSKDKYKKGDGDIHEIVFENGRVIRLLEDGMLVFIDPGLAGDHAGRGRYAAYARSEVKVQHEIAELRALAEWASEKKIISSLAQATKGDGLLGKAIRDYINGTKDGQRDLSVTDEEVLKRQNEFFKVSAEFHEAGLQAEAKAAGTTYTPSTTAVTDTLGQAVVENADVAISSQGKPSSLTQQASIKIDQILQKNRGTVLTRNERNEIIKSFIDGGGKNLDIIEAKVTAIAAIKRLKGQKIETAFVGQGSYSVVYEIVGPAAAVDGNVYKYEYEIPTEVGGFTRQGTDIQDGRTEEQLVSAMNQAAGATVALSTRQVNSGGVFLTVQSKSVTLRKKLSKTEPAVAEKILTAWTALQTRLFSAGFVVLDANLDNFIVNEALDADGNVTYQVLVSDFHQVLQVSDGAVVRVTDASGIVTPKKFKSPAAAKIFQIQAMLYYLNYFMVTQLLMTKETNRNVLINFTVAQAEFLPIEIRSLAVELLSNETKRNQFLDAMQEFREACLDGKSADIAKSLNKVATLLGKGDAKAGRALLEKIWSNIGLAQTIKNTAEVTAEYSNAELEKQVSWAELVSDPTQPVPNESSKAATEQRQQDKQQSQAETQQARTQQTFQTGVTAFEASLKAREYEAAANTLRKLLALSKNNTDQTQFAATVKTLETRLNKTVNDQARLLAEPVIADAKRLRIVAEDNVQKKDIDLLEVNIKAMEDAAAELLDIYETHSKITNKVDLNTDINRINREIYTLKVQALELRLNTAIKSTTAYISLQEMEGAFKAIVDEATTLKVDLEKVKAALDKKRIAEKNRFAQEKADRIEKNKKRAEEIKIEAARKQKFNDDFSVVAKAIEDKNPISVVEELAKLERSAKSSEEIEKVKILKSQHEKARVLQQAYITARTRFQEFLSNGQLSFAQSMIDFMKKSEYKNEADIQASQIALDDFKTRSAAETVSFRQRVQTAVYSWFAKPKLTPQELSKQQKLTAFNTALKEGKYREALAVFKSIEQSPDEFKKMEILALEKTLLDTVKKIRDARLVQLKAEADARAKKAEEDERIYEEMKVAQAAKRRERIQRVIERAEKIAVQAEADSGKPLTVSQREVILRQAEELEDFSEFAASVSQDDMSAIQEELFAVREIDNLTQALVVAAENGSKNEISRIKRELYLRLGKNKEALNTVLAKAKTIFKENRARRQANITEINEKAEQKAKQEEQARLAEQAKLDEETAEKQKLAEEQAAKSKVAQETAVVETVTVDPAIAAEAAAQARLVLEQKKEQKRVEELTRQADQAMTDATEVAMAGKAEDARASLENAMKQMAEEELARITAERSVEAQRQEDAAKALAEATENTRTAFLSAARKLAEDNNVDVSDLSDAISINLRVEETLEKRAAEQKLAAKQKAQQQKTLEATREQELAKNRLIARQATLDHAQRSLAEVLNAEQTRTVQQAQERIDTALKDRKDIALTPNEQKDFELALQNATVRLNELKAAEAQKVGPPSTALIPVKNTAVLPQTVSIPSITQNNTALTPQGVPGPLSVQNNEILSPAASIPAGLEDLARKLSEAKTLREQIVECKRAIDQFESRRFAGESINEDHYKFVALLFSKLNDVRKARSNEQTADIQAEMKSIAQEIKKIEYQATPAVTGVTENTLTPKQAAEHARLAEEAEARWKEFEEEERVQARMVESEQKRAEVLAQKREVANEKEYEQMKAEFEQSELEKVSQEQTRIEKQKEQERIAAQESATWAEREAELKVKKDKTAAEADAKTESEWSQINAEIDELAKEDARKKDLKERKDGSLESSVSKSLKAEYEERSKAEVAEKPAKSQAQAELERALDYSWYEKNLSAIVAEFNQAVRNKDIPAQMQAMDKIQKALARKNGGKVGIKSIDDKIAARKEELQTEEITQAELSIASEALSDLNKNKDEEEINRIIQIFNSDNVPFMIEIKPGVSVRSSVVLRSLTDTQATQIKKLILARTVTQRDFYVALGLDLQYGRNIKDRFESLAVDVNPSDGQAIQENWFQAIRDELKSRGETEIDIKLDKIKREVKPAPQETQDLKAYYGKQFTTAMTDVLEGETGLSNSVAMLAKAKFLKNNAAKKSAGVIDREDLSETDKLSVIAEQKKSWEQAIIEVLVNRGISAEKAGALALQVVAEVDVLETDFKAKEIDSVKNITEDQIRQIYMTKFIDACGEKKAVKEALTKNPVIKIGGQSFLRSAAVEFVNRQPAGRTRKSIDKLRNDYRSAKNDVEKRQFAERLGDLAGADKDAIVAVAPRPVLRPGRTTSKTSQSSSVMAMSLNPLPLLLAADWTNKPGITIVLAGALVLGALSLVPQFRAKASQWKDALFNRFTSVDVGLAKVGDVTGSIFPSATDSKQLASAYEDRMQLKDQVAKNKIGQDEDGKSVEEQLKEKKQLQEKEEEINKRIQDLETSIGARGVKGRIQKRLRSIDGFIKTMGAVGKFYSWTGSMVGKLGQFISYTAPKIVRRTSTEQLQVTIEDQDRINFLRKLTGLSNDDSKVIKEIFDGDQKQVSEGDEDKFIGLNQELDSRQPERQQDRAHGNDSGSRTLIQALERIQEMVAKDAFTKEGIKKGESRTAEDVDGLVKKYMNGEIPGKINKDISDRAYFLFKELLKISKGSNGQSYNHLVQAIDNVRADNATEMYKQLRASENFDDSDIHIFNAFVFRQAAGFTLFSKQLRASANINGNHLAAGTGTGKTFVMIIAAAKFLAKQFNQTDAERQYEGKAIAKGPVIIQVPNDALREQFMTDKTNHYLVSMLSGGKAKLRDGKVELLEALRGQKTEQDVLAKLNDQDVFIIDSQSAGFLRQQSTSMNGLITRRLQNIPEFWDEGDAAFMNGNAYVGSHETSGEEAKAKQQLARDQHKLNMLRFKRATEILRTFPKEQITTTNLEEFQRSWLHSRDEIKIFRNIATGEVMVNQAVLDLMGDESTEDGRAIRQGGNDSKGFQLEGLEKGHINTVFSVLCLDKGAIGNFRGITFDPKKGRYIFVADDQLRANQIPSDSQLLVALNEKRREAGMQSVEYSENLPQMQTSGGVSRFELFIKTPNFGFVRMASATQGETDAFGKAIQSVPVYDVELNRTIDENQPGFDMVDWLKTKNKGNASRQKDKKTDNWTYRTVKGDGAREAAMYDLIDEFMGVDPNKPRNDVAKKTNASMLISFDRLDDSLRALCQDRIRSNISKAPEYKERLARLDGIARVNEIDKIMRELILVVDGRTTDDAAVVEGIVRGVRGQRKIVFTDLVGARGNDFQADMMIVNANQRMTPGEIGQMHGRGERSKKGEGGRFDVHRVELMDEQFITSQIRDFWTASDKLIEFMEQDPRVSPVILKIFKKIASLKIDKQITDEELMKQLGNGVNDLFKVDRKEGDKNEPEPKWTLDDALLLFRSEINLIKKRHEKMLQLFSEGGSYYAITKPLNDAIAETVEGSSERELLQRFKTELFQREGGGSSAQDVHLSDVVLTPEQSLQTSFEGFMRRADQMYKRFYTESKDAYSQKVKDIFDKAMTEIESVSGQKLYQIRSEEKASKGADSAKSLMEFLGMSGRFLVALAPTNKTNQTPPEDLAVLLDRKKAEYELTKEDAKRSNERAFSDVSPSEYETLVREVIEQSSLSDEQKAVKFGQDFKNPDGTFNVEKFIANLKTNDVKQLRDLARQRVTSSKIEYIMKVLLPLLQMLHCFGSSSDEEEKVLREFISHVDDDVFIHGMLRMLDARKKIGSPNKGVDPAEEDMKSAAEALNMHFFNNNLDFHVIARDSGTGRILISTYKVESHRPEMITRNVEFFATSQEQENADKLETGKDRSDVSRRKQIDGLVLARLDDSLDELDAPLDVAQSLGNNAFERVFKDKADENVRGEYRFKFNGQEERILGEIKDEMLKLAQSNQNIGKWVTKTGEGRFAFNPKKFEREFAREVQKEMIKGTPDEGKDLPLSDEHIKLGRKLAQRMSSIVNEVNGALTQVYDKRPATEKEADKGIKQEGNELGNKASIEKINEKMDQALEGSAHHRILLTQAIFGSDPVPPNYTPSAEDHKRIEQSMGYMLMTHEFTHELHSSLLGDAYRTTDGGDKEYIAHLGAFSRALDPKDRQVFLRLVFLQTYGYLSTAPDTDGWKERYKIPTLEIYKDLAKHYEDNPGSAKAPEGLLTSKELDEWFTDFSKFKGEKEKNLKRIRQFQEFLLAQGDLDKVSFGLMRNKMGTTGVKFDANKTQPGETPEARKTEIRTGKKPSESSKKEVEEGSKNVAVLMNSVIDEFISEPAVPAGSAPEGARLYEEAANKLHTRIGNVLGSPDEIEKILAQTAENIALRLQAKTISEKDVRTQFKTALKSLETLAKNSAALSGDALVTRADEAVETALKKVQAGQTQKFLNGRVRVLNKAANDEEFQTRQITLQSRIESVREFFGIVILENDISSDQKIVQLTRAAVSLNAKPGTESIEPWVTAYVLDEMLPEKEGAPIGRVGAQALIQEDIRQNTVAGKSDRNTTAINSVDSMLMREGYSPSQALQAFFTGNAEFFELEVSGEKLYDKTTHELYADTLESEQKFFTAAFKSFKEQNGNKDKKTQISSQSFDKIKKKREEIISKNSKNSVKALAELHRMAVDPSHSDFFPGEENKETRDAIQQLYESLAQPLAASFNRFLDQKSSQKLNSQQQKVLEEIKSKRDGITQSVNVSAVTAFSQLSQLLFNPEQELKDGEEKAAGIELIVTFRKTIDGEGVEAVDPAIKMAYKLAAVTMASSSASKSIGDTKVIDIKVTKNLVKTLNALASADEDTAKSFKKTISSVEFNNEPIGSLDNFIAVFELLNTEPACKVLFDADKASFSLSISEGVMRVNLKSEHVAFSKALAQLKKSDRILKLRQDITKYNESMRPINEKAAELQKKASEIRSKQSAIEEDDKKLEEQKKLEVEALEEQMEQLGKEYKELQKQAKELQEKNKKTIEDFSAVQALDQFTDVDDLAAYLSPQTKPETLKAYKAKDSVPAPVDKQEVESALVTALRSGLSSLSDREKETLSARERQELFGNKFNKLKIETDWDPDKIIDKALREIALQGADTKEVADEIASDIETTLYGLKHRDKKFQESEKFQNALKRAQPVLLAAYNKAKALLPPDRQSDLPSFPDILKKFIAVKKDKWNEMETIVAGKNGKKSRVTASVKAMASFGGDVVLVPANEDITEYQLLGLILHEAGHLMSVDYFDETLREGTTELRARQLLYETVFEDVKSKNGGDETKARAQAERAVNEYMSMGGGYGSGLYQDKVDYVHETFGGIAAERIDLARITGDPRHLHPEKYKDGVPPPVEFAKKGDKDEDKSKPAEQKVPPVGSPEHTLYLIANAKTVAELESLKTDKQFRRNLGKRSGGEGKKAFDAKMAELSKKPEPQLQPIPTPLLAPSSNKSISESPQPSTSTSQSAQQAQEQPQSKQQPQQPVKSADFIRFETQIEVFETDLSALAELPLDASDLEIGKYIYKLDDILEKFTAVVPVASSDNAETQKVLVERAEKSFKTVAELLCRLPIQSSGNGRIMTYAEKTLRRLKNISSNKALVMEVEQIIQRTKNEIKIIEDAFVVLNRSEVTFNKSNQADAARAKGAIVGLKERISAETKQRADEKYDRIAKYVNDDEYRKSIDIGYLKPKLDSFEAQQKQVVANEKSLLRDVQDSGLRNATANEKDIEGMRKIVEIKNRLDDATRLEDIQRLEREYQSALTVFGKIEELYEVPDAATVASAVSLTAHLNNDIDSMLDAYKSTFISIAERLDIDVERDVQIEAVLPKIIEKIKRLRERFSREHQQNVKKRTQLNAEISQLSSKSTEFKSDASIDQRFKALSDEADVKKAFDAFAGEAAATKIPILPSGVRLANTSLLADIDQAAAAYKSRVNPSQPAKVDEVANFIKDIASRSSDGFEMSAEKFENIYELIGGYDLSGDIASTIEGSLIEVVIRSGLDGVTQQYFMGLSAVVDKIYPALRSLTESASGREVTIIDFIQNAVTLDKNTDSDKSIDIIVDLKLRAGIKADNNSALIIFSFPYSPSGIDTVLPNIKEINDEALAVILDRGLDVLQKRFLLTSVAFKKFTLAQKDQLLERAIKLQSQRLFSKGLDNIFMLVDAMNFTSQELANARARVIRALPAASMKDTDPTLFTSKMSEIEIKAFEEAVLNGQSLDEFTHNRAFELIDMFGRSRDFLTRSEPYLKKILKDKSVSPYLRSVALLYLSSLSDDQDYGVEINEIEKLLKERNKQAPATSFINEAEILQIRPSLVLRANALVTTWKTSVNLGVSVTDYSDFAGGILAYGKVNNGVRPGTSSFEFSKDFLSKRSREAILAFIAHEFGHNVLRKIGIWTYKQRGTDHPFIGYFHEVFADIVSFPTILDETGLSLENFFESALRKEYSDASIEGADALESHKSAREVLRKFFRRYQLSTQVSIDLAKNVYDELKATALELNLNKEDLVGSEKKLFEWLATSAKNAGDIPDNEVLDINTGLAREKVILSLLVRNLPDDVTTKEETSILTTQQRADQIANRLQGGYTHEDMLNPKTDLGLRESYAAALNRAILYGGDTELRSLLEQLKSAEEVAGDEGVLTSDVEDEPLPDSESGARMVQSVNAETQQPLLQVAITGARAASFSQTLKTAIGGALVGIAIFASSAEAESAYQNSKARLVIVNSDDVSEQQAVVASEKILEEQQVERIQEIYDLMLAADKLPNADESNLRNLAGEIIPLLGRLKPVKVDEFLSYDENYLAISKQFERLFDESQRRQLANAIDTYATYATEQISEVLELQKTNPNIKAISVSDVLDAQGRLDATTEKLLRSLAPKYGKQFAFYSTDPNLSFQALQSLMPQAKFFNVNGKQDILSQLHPLVGEQPVSLLIQDKQLQNMQASISQQMRDRLVVLPSEIKAGEPGITAAQKIALSVIAETKETSVIAVGESVLEKIQKIITWRILQINIPIQIFEELSKAIASLRSTASAA